MSVDVVVKGVAGEDSSVPVYAQIGRKVNEPALLRLASFVAYRMQTLFLDDTPAFYTHADGSQDETSKAMLADVERVRAVMYPCDDPVVTDAIARHIEATSTEGGFNSSQWAIKEAAIYDDLLGVPHEESIKSTYRTIAISTSIAAARGMIAEILDSQM